ncbi:MAG TPA: plasmid replication protein RepC [Stellaceae bacterium]|nr:plasmid replication protein RepC [Stellaceae bacterium]
MAHENCAPGAPRAGFARSATGFRRLTPGLLRTDRAAEGFAGLPAGAAMPGQLLAAFKEAAPQLGISPRLVHAVDWLFCFTQPQDWQAGARPIVWPSARMQQEALGLSPTQAKAINRRLIELGLVSMKDSANGKRYGCRDPQGRIVEAYGFDLAPIAARYGEFRRLAEEGRTVRQAMGRLRRRATIAKKAIVQILETASEYGFAGEEWPALARDMAALGRALRAVERVDEMEVGVASLERRQTAARERLEALLGTMDSGPMGAKNRPHYNNYKPTPDPEQDTVIAAENCNRAGQGPEPSLPAPALRRRPDKGMLHGVAPDELVRLAPRLKPYLRRPSPTWPELIDAADWLRHDLGVSKALWGEACLAMGRELAAVALAVVSTKEPGHFTASPGGYFHGMVARAKLGELRLERTVWALRRAAQPEHERSRGRDRRPDGFRA